MFSGITVMVVFFIQYNCRDDTKLRKVYAVVRNWLKSCEGKKCMVLRTYIQTEIFGILKYAQESNRKNYKIVLENTHVLSAKLHCQKSEISEKCYVF